MLATFLLGLALGSFLFSLGAKRFRIDFSLFVVLQLLTAVFALWGLALFDDIPYYFVQLYERFQNALGYLYAARFLLCGVIMLPPTICIGAMFACFIHLYRSSDRLGREVGQAYFANTVGAILGSILTGFLLIPAVGIQKTLLSGAVLNMVVGVGVFILVWRTCSWKSRILIVGLFGFVLVGSEKSMRNRLAPKLNKKLPSARPNRKVASMIEKA